MIEINCAASGGVTLAGPEINVTLCPSANAASSIAYPIFPEERLLIKRTGSIDSRVGPAVTTNLTRSNYPGAPAKIPREKQCHPLSTDVRRLHIRTRAFLLPDR